MNRHLFAIAFAALTVSVIADPQPAADAPGWKPLIAADLSDVDFTPGVWTVENGVFTASKDEALWTKTEHENYFLDVEFKTAPGTNSGVIVHSTDTKNWIPKAIEIQIADPFADKWAKAAPTWHGGGIFGHLAPSKQMFRKPGEWNRMTILAKGRMVKVWVNGEVTAEMDMDKWTDAKKNPDGSDIPSWLPVPVAKIPSKGKIGFQGKHGDATVWFRNVRIKAAE